MTVEDIKKAWGEFWFTEESPAPICLFRIFYGSLVFLSGISWISDLFTWFGPRGAVSIATMLQYEGSPRFSLFYWLPQTNETVVFLCTLFLLSALCVALGLFTRASTIVLWILLVSFHHLNPIILNSGDSLLRMMGFLLMMSPAGAMFSLDYLIKRKRGIGPSDPWTIRCSSWVMRLMQLQVAAVYCQTFWTKFIGDTWWNGTAVYYATRLEEFRRLPVPFVLDHLWTIKLLTWGTLLVEFSMWTLIWVKEYRYWVIGAAILMHLGIDWTLNIPLFEYIMISSFIVFVDPNDIRRLFALFKKRPVETRSNKSLLQIKV